MATYSHCRECGCDLFELQEIESEMCNECQEKDDGRKMMSERWRIVIELTYEKESGDDPFDAGGYGAELCRAKERLETLLDGKPFKHYHVLMRPHRTFEFD